MVRNLIDLSKVLPISREKIKKYIRCTHLWKAISPIPEKDMKFEFINDNLIHQDVNYTFTIGLTGLIKHTAHIVQDVQFEEQGDEYILTVVKSTEVAKSEVRVKIEDMGDKINIKVSLIQLYFKRGVLELVGRRIVINRFRGEIRKLLKKAARKLRDGSLDPILKKCDEELEKANQE
ncbi:MAG: hypothetical protein HWN66_01030 [Candidatus Helarchaeota archaeon]|nr:hypothetical protein [Candidatus Helarchaeota archaeon]